MALTRSFKELVQKRVASVPGFGEALLREGIDTMLAGDVDTGKVILRDYIKATIGFERLGERQSAGEKPLQRARLLAEAGRFAAACGGGPCLRVRKGRKGITR